MVCDDSFVSVFSFYNYLKLFGLLTFFLSLSLFAAECEELARKFGCKYFETSAKNDVNVYAVFEEITLQVHRYEKAASKALESAPGPETKKAKVGCMDRCVVL